jgi:hypothetical protein
VSPAGYAPIKQIAHEFCARFLIIFVQKKNVPEYFAFIPDSCRVLIKNPSFFFSRQ